MAGILSQDEVDALLQAVETGAVALNDGTGRNGGTDQELEIADYSFRRPNLLTRDQLRLFSTIHDHFGTEAQSRLSLTLRASSDVKLVASDQLQYSEFIMSLPDVTHLSVLRMESPSGHLVFEVSLSFIFTIVDVILGGDGAAPVEHRQLTDVESAIARPIVDELIADLERSLGHVCNCKLTAGQMESSPQYVHAAPGDTPSMVMTFEAKVGSGSGVINLCYPIPLVERMLANAHRTPADQSLFTDDAPKVHDEQASRNAVLGVPVQMHVQLATAWLTIGELSSLRVGDVLVTDTPITSLNRVYVAGVPMFVGRPGRRKHHLALRITGTCRPPPS